MLSKLETFHNYMRSCGIEGINRDLEKIIYDKFLSRIGNPLDFQLYMTTGLYLRTVLE